MFVVSRERVDQVGKRLILELALLLPGSGYYPEVPALELKFPYAFLYFQTGLLLRPSILIPYPHRVGQ